MRSIHRKKMPVAISALLLVGLAAGGHAADSPKPTPTKTPRPAGGTALNEMAKDTELKGGEKGQPIVITNENLSSYAEKGSVTASSESDAAKRRPVRDPLKVDPVPPLVPGQGNIDERRRYWQNQYKSKIDLVASIRYQINVLDGEIPGLWRDFYAWDDPMYRDGVIKPRLDRSLERRDQLAVLLLKEEPKLAEIKEQARKDGGEPGWWREIKEPTPLPKNPKTGPGDAIRASDRESTEPPK